MEEQKPCVCKDMNICLENLCWYITAYGLFHHGFMYRRQASCSQLEALKMEPHEWPCVWLFWHLLWESQCLAHTHYHCHLLSPKWKANTPDKEFDLRNYRRDTDTTNMYELQWRPHTIEWRVHQKSESPQAWWPKQTTWRLGRGKKTLLGLASV